MKVNKLFVVLGLLVMLAAALPALAQPAGPPPPPPPHGAPPPNPAIGMAGWALHGLELNQAQREQIHDAVYGYIESDLGQQLRDFDMAKRVLEIAIWSPAASEEDIGSASETVAGLARQLELTRHRLALDVLQILTEEQREDFQQMLETEPPLPGGPGHGGPGGPGGRRGPGPQGS